MSVFIQKDPSVLFWGNVLCLFRLLYWRRKNQKKVWRMCTGYVSISLCTFVMGVAFSLNISCMLSFWLASQKRKASLVFNMFTALVLVRISLWNLSDFVRNLYTYIVVMHFIIVIVFWRPFYYVDIYICFFLFFFSSSFLCCHPVYGREPQSFLFSLFFTLWWVWTISVTNQLDLANLY